MKKALAWATTGILTVALCVFAAGSTLMLFEPPPWIAHLGKGAAIIVTVLFAIGAVTNEFFLASPFRRKK